MAKETKLLTTLTVATMAATETVNLNFGSRQFDGLDRLIVQVIGISTDAETTFDVEGSLKDDSAKAASVSTGNTVGGDGVAAVVLQFPYDYAQIKVNKQTATTGTLEVWVGYD